MRNVNKKKTMIEMIELYLNSNNIIKGHCSVSLLDKGIESKNYLISDKDKSRYILKVYSESNNEEILYEIEILNKLDSIFSRKYFPVVIKGIFYINKKPSILLKFIPGHILSKKDISSHVIKTIAKKQAEMHRFLIDFEPKHKKNRFSIFDFSFLNLYVNNKNTYYNILQDEIKCLEQESKILKKLSYTKSIIHEDLNAENIILSKNGHINFIDFGESHRAEIISDIAISIKENIIRNKGIDFSLIQDYLNSYQKIFCLNKDEISALLFLLKRRTIFMMAYLLNKQEMNKSIEIKKKIAVEAKILKTLQKNSDLIKIFIKEYKYE